MKNYSPLTSAPMPDSLSILAARMDALRRPKAGPVMVTAPTPPAAPEPLALTLRQAAKLVGVHPRTLRGWPLPWVKVGRVIRIMRTDLESFLVAHADKKN